MLSFLGIYCVIYGIVMGGVKAEKVEDLKQEYANIVKECIGKHSLTSADLNALSNNKRTDNVNCIFACALKKSGMMDDDGNLSVEGMRRSVEKHFSNDPELIKKSDMFTDACISVNDVPVTDGNKGCERASLIYQCSVEKAPSFDLF